MLNKTLATTLFALSLVACGGNAESDSEQGTGGSGATSTGGSATGGKAGMGGSSTGGSSTGGAPSGGSGGSATGGAPSGGGTSAGGAAGGGAGGTGGGECVPQTGGTGGFQQPTCNDLNVMNVTDPKVEDESGDGAVSAGEKFTVLANLKEIAGIGHSYYPGVYFTSDNPEVMIKENDWFYAIFACQTMPVTATGKVGPNVASGTVVTITAQVGEMNTECVNAPSIQIPITIQ